jgi:hypothetical protein
MSLSVYEFDDDNSQFLTISKNGAQSNPVQTTHNGTDGQVVEKKLYLRNDDTDSYYTTITLVPTPARKVRVGDINYPEAFINYKIIVQDEQPTESEWLAVESGNTATFADIGTTLASDTSYKPFWVQVGISAGTRVQTISDVALHMDAEENAVGS